MLDDLATWRPDAPGIRAQFGDRLVNARWLIRERSDAGQPLVIDSASEISKLEASAPNRTSPLDPVERVLGLFAESDRSIGDPLTLNPDIDFLRVRAKRREELEATLNLMKEELHLVQFDRGGTNWTVRPTAKGWERIAALRLTSKRSDVAFVAMWFDRSTESAWSDGIEPALRKDCRYEPVRIDKVHFDNKVDDEILARIRTAGLLVADLTGNRAGVYFEAGFAMGLGIPVVWCCHESHLKDVHFDASHYPFLVWADPAHLRKLVSARVNARHPRPS